MGRASISRAAALAIAVSATLLSGCAGGSLPSLPKISELNPFAEAEVKLPGKRVPVTPASNQVGAELAPADRPIELPAPALNGDWSQPGGSPDNAPGHLAYEGGGKRSWKTSVGAGSSKRARLSASPIVYGERIYTLDAESVVVATSATSGARAWRTALVPEAEGAGEGYGGGLAAADGRIYVSTGYGSVAALDPNSGKVIWQTALKVPLRASPTAAEGQVFVIATDGRVFGLNGTDGMELWQFRGLPQTTALISNPSPAVSGGMALVPFPSGDLVALKLADGLPAWSESLSSTRMSGMGSLSDVSRPVVSGGIVYAAGNSGRLIASSLSTGERIWALDVPGIQPPAVAGSTLFVVDTQGQLLAIDAKAGKALWTVKLPGATWSGPTLASGRLWLTSSAGQLAAVDAATGRILSQSDLGEPIYLAPIVAAGRMYVLTDAGSLMAFN